MNHMQSEYPAKEAIRAIKEDLELDRPMDRLLCGDVGFGKTEVAMRAAFKVVEGGYQVAVLAPTTILADQHLETFRSRFAGAPIRVEMLSRRRSPGEYSRLLRSVLVQPFCSLLCTLYAPFPVPKSAPAQLKDNILFEIYPFNLAVSKF